ncbi:MAG: amidase [Longimicrobiales bacterium]
MTPEPASPAWPSLAALAADLRAGRTTASAVLEGALSHHREHEPPLGAYKLVDEDGARAAAHAADRAFADHRNGGPDPAPLCGIPVSVKDLYGMDGLPTWAGTARQLPDRWSSDAWLVGRLRRQGAVFVGKTHTVELAYAGVGLNPHWGTPRNACDPDVHRIPGGSSSGAGVSLQEGSALVALGTDTGGSIRIPASMTGMVGHKSTKGRWPTDGVVPLSHTLDTVGALTRSAADAAWFFAAVDSRLGDPAAFLSDTATPRSLRIGVPRCGLWDGCQDDIATVLERALDALTARPADAPGAEAGGDWTLVEVDGDLLDRAADLYLTGAIAGAECLAFLQAELPEWIPLLHPIVGSRLTGAPALDSATYPEARRRQDEMAADAAALFRTADVLVLPGHLDTPAPVSELDDPERYRTVNLRALRPTCCVSLLGLCALTLPVGSDRAGMPVGLQLVAPAGADEALLAAAVSVERRLADAR